MLKLKPRTLSPTLPGTGVHAPDDNRRLGEEGFRLWQGPEGMSA